MLKQLNSLLGEYRIYAILSPLLIAGEVMMEIAIPFVMANMLDNGVLGSGGISYTVKMGCLMILMAVISLIFGALAGRMAAKASTGLAANIRNTLFDQVMNFSFSNVDKFSTASLITRLTSDVTNVQNAFMMIIRMGVRAPIMLIGATTMAVLISRRLSLVFLIAIPILGVALFYIIKNGFPRFQRMLTHYDTMNAAVQENLIGIRVVKAFVREDHETKKFTDNAQTLRQAQFFAEKLIILNMPIMQLTIFGCIVAVVWYGGNLVIGGGLEIGQLSAFLTYNSQILMSLMFLSMIFIMCVLSRASVARIQEVLNEISDIRDAADSAPCPKDGSIEFVDASFSYGGEEDNLTLENINLHIRSGEIVGIIGGTGSAKSTLVQLIPRLYDLSGGQLLVGGHPVKEYSLNTLRGCVSMVLQKNVLFSGTIRENLLWGNPDATQLDLDRACQAAQAKEFIDKFSDGYETLLEQGGTNLSGGQKQRLCIARALLSRPKIIILDDSTSAVDTATDAKIREGMRRELKGTTVLLIAQRITSVCDADKIIVMDNGTINAVGTHEELLQSNEIYREVYESQQKGGLPQ